MRVLVTGGAGFIGSHTADALLARGDEVVVLDDLSTGDAAAIPPAAAFHRGCVADPAALATACAGVDAVVHLAAVSTVPAATADPDRAAQVNIVGTARVLQAAAAAGARSVVLASSSSVYGLQPDPPWSEGCPPAPISVYGGSKAAAEQVAAGWAPSLGVASVVLRYFNVYGPRQRGTSAVPGFIDAALAGRAATIHGAGDQTRDFVYVADVVRSTLAALDLAKALDGLVINVASGAAVSVTALHAAVAGAVGVSVPPVHAPTRRGDPPHGAADVRMLRAALEVRDPVPLTDGLARTAAWARAGRDPRGAA